MKKKSILILTPSIPFSRGGAEILIERLISSFNRLGHNADLFSIPFFPEPKTKLLEQAALWRSQDLSRVSGRKIDMVIPLKFPSFYVKHECKVPWLLHQHRQAYELVGTRFGDFSENDEMIRSAIVSGDTKSLLESKKIFTISENVSSRLREFNKLNSEVIHPPLPWENKFYNKDKKNYILYVGRLCTPKRIDLIIESLANINSELNLLLVGKADEPGYRDYLDSLILKHGISDRVDFKEGVSEDTLIDLYANCFCVFYAPYDEDYGFVTYEAAASSKPLITLSDSGFVASEVKRLNSGIVCEEDKIAFNINNLFKDDSLYSELSSNASKSKINIDWNYVAEKFIELIN